MRIAVALTILICCAHPVWAQPKRIPPPEVVEDADFVSSAQILDLQRKLTAGDKGALAAFWKAMGERGTPLVEPLADAPHHVLVTFLYRGDTARHVVLMRSGADDPRLSQLTRLPGTDVWVRSYRMRDDARFGYSFGPDFPLAPLTPKVGFPQLRWQLRADPLNHRRIDLSSSLCALPNAPAQPLTVPVAGVPVGEVHIHKVASRLLGNNRRIYVYTPPGYRAGGGPYPMVVLFDGLGYLSDIPTATILDNLIAQKRLPPTIALLIDQVARPLELGLGDKFADVVAGEMVPFVQRRYHATADPRAVVVGGLSLGGLEATWAAFRHPEVFGNVLSQSGSYWWFKDGDDEYEWLTRQIAGAPHKPIRFYLEVGLLEGGAPGAPSMVIVNRHLRDVLSAKGYPVTFRTFVGGHHPTSWRGTLGDGLVELLGDVRPRRATPRAPTDDLKVEDLGFSSLVPLLRAVALGGTDEALRVFREGREHSQDVDERSLNTLGYALLYGMGQAQAAIAVFEDAVKRFPKSGNAYDSLGEALYVGGDRGAAISAYKRSLELDPKNENAVNLLKLLGQH